MGVVNHSVEQNSDGDAAYQRALKLGQEILPQVCCVLINIQIQKSFYRYVYKPTKSGNPSTGMFGYPGSIRAYGDLPCWVRFHKH